MERGITMSKKAAKPFWSIRNKLLIVFVTVTTAALLSYFSFFRSYTYRASLERYEEQLVPLRDALVQNVDYYITTCVEASRSIYYNTTAKRLLNYTSGNFSNSETKDSQDLFAYMLSVYASIPSAAQIRLSAYKLRRSFLVTTYDLAHYMDIRNDYSFETENPRQFSGSLDQSIWVESSHLMGSYGHFVTSKPNRSQHVFTVHTPIYNLPDSTDIVGLLSVDISTRYIEDNCAFAHDEGAAVYLIDDTSQIVYAADSQLIGKSIGDPQYGADLWLKEDAPAIGSYTQNGQLVTVRDFDSRHCPWRLYIVTPLDYVYRDTLTSQIVLMGVFAFYLVFLTALMFCVLLRYVRPLNQIALFIRANISREGYNKDARLSNFIRYTANDEVGVLLESIDSMLDSMDDFVLRHYQMQLANRTSDLRTLQAQVNPHFIYNTLQCIASKALQNGDMESYNYLASFGQMLQYAMNVDESMVPLAREIEHVKRYLSLQSARFDQALEFILDAPDEVLTALVPKMCLQPLAENTVIHGRLYEHRGGYIRLHARIDGNRLVMIMEDNGIPITQAQALAVTERLMRLRQDLDFMQTLYPPAAREFSDMLQVEQLSGQAAGDNRIGIANVYLRFLLRFGSDCKFSIYANDQGGTTVRLELPYKQVLLDEGEGSVNKGDVS